MVFLQKLVPHRSLTLPFEPFQFWLRIYRKTTPRLGNWGSQRLSNSPSRRVGESSSYSSGKGSSSNTFKCGPVIATISKRSESFDNVFFNIEAKQTRSIVILY
jgi:hypothetical protein